MKTLTHPLRPPQTHCFFLYPFPLFPSSNPPCRHQHHHGRHPRRAVRLGEAHRQLAALPQHGEQLDRGRGAPRDAGGHEGGRLFEEREDLRAEVLSAGGPAVREVPGSDELAAEPLLGALRGSLRRHALRVASRGLVRRAIGRRPAPGEREAQHDGVALVPGVPADRELARPRGPGLRDPRLRLADPRPRRAHEPPGRERAREDLVQGRE